MSPLGEFAPLVGAVSLVERTGLGALSVRGSGVEFFAAAARALGVALPAEPTTTRRHGCRLAVWLGPDEWLVRVPLGEVEGLASARRGGGCLGSGLCAASSRRRGA